MEEIIKCPNCGKHFSYGLIGPSYPGGKDKEYVDCPYCGHTYMTIMTSRILVIEGKEPEEDLSKTLKKK